MLTVAFLVHALTHDRPMINLRFTACDDLPLIALCISFFRLVVMSASCIIPQYQKFLSTHAAVFNTFNVQCHLTSAQTHRTLRTAAMSTWLEVVAAV